MAHEFLEALPMPALLVARDGHIEGTNADARQMFGDGIQDRHYITVLRQPVILDAVETALKQGQRTTANFLTTEARKDVTLHVTCSPLPSSGVLIVMEDRTPLQDAEQQRRDFVANVSHELRTPLTALSGFIETLRGAAKDDPQARDRFLAIMETEAGRMNRLVSDLLSLGRVEADARVRPTENVDLAGVVDTVLSTLRPMAEKLGVSIETKGLEKQAILPGDADQLNQVARNLIENAIKYSGKGSTVSVTLRMEDNNAMLRGPAWVLDVIDRGDGIAAQHIPRLTERFYRIDNHRSREIGGTGLGLAIVKHITNRHRGRLRIESTPGQGSQFSVILPAVNPTSRA